MATDPWGVDDGWEDTGQRWHVLDPEVAARLRRAMGGDAGADRPPPGPGVVRARPGRATALDAPAVVRLEDGTDLGRRRDLPPDLPVGIHELRAEGDGRLLATVLAGPGRCHLPNDLRTWGLAMQVPTSRSSTSWGIGDLADVRRVADLVADHGGGALLLSPTHAPTPVPPIPRSPYSPSSRRWHSPLLLRVDAVPGAADDEAVAREAAAARALLGDPVVDRDRAWRGQRSALEHLWAALPDAERSRLERWRAAQGGNLEGWARYCALAEVHGPAWPEWPAELRHPQGPGVAGAVAPLADRIAFHAWLQLLLADQLADTAPEGLRIFADLAIGVDPAGADAWMLQDLLALDVSIGAPPDDFSMTGQRWGLPPFVPWKLRAAGYRPVADLLRAAMAIGGGLRVDHVMGLDRLWWVPEGSDATRGGYVRYPGHELLEVLAVESARAEAVVVGEDLGTVEDQLRDALVEARVLTSRVVWFDDDPPTEAPEASLGVVTTHDLPTVTGVWSGADDAELDDLGVEVPAGATAEVRRRLDALVGLPPDAAPAEVVAAVHRCVSEGRSAVVLGTLEDLCAVPHRPNVPGTTSERANWSRALPVPVDRLADDERAKRSVEALAEPRRPGATG
jgi:4-alpha-glucanotransferase